MRSSVRNPHFRYDEANTAEQVTFLIKTGGGSPKLGQSAGIHWHMIIENAVHYVAEDETLQVIPWVSVKRPDGSSDEYRSKESKLTAEQLEAMPKHTMDCMDCHNRPTHVYQAPEGAVDVAMASGLISPGLPWIKKVAVDALVREYPDREAAKTGLRGRDHRLLRQELSRREDHTGERTSSTRSTPSRRSTAGPSSRP